MRGLGVSGIAHDEEISWKNWLRSCEAWWYHDIETLYASVGLCAGNQMVGGRFPSQRTMNVEFWVNCSTHSRFAGITVVSSMKNNIHTAVLSLSSPVVNTCSNRFAIVCNNAPICFGGWVVTECLERLRLLWVVKLLLGFRGHGFETTVLLM